MFKVKEECSEEKVVLKKTINCFGVIHKLHMLSSERGTADHGWLDTKHTFSFHLYHDPKFTSFGPLRVLNEDRVKGGRGFGTHPHRNFEIFSYVISGSLLHKDSMGNEEVIKRGDIQFTSAGKGIMHSEYNNSKKKNVHFLQIWVKPDTYNLEPTYQTVCVRDEEKINTLRKIIMPKYKQEKNSIMEDNIKKEETMLFDNVIRIDSNISVFACLLECDNFVRHSLGVERQVYIHVCDTGGSVVVNGKKLLSGDGCFILSSKKNKKKKEKTYEITIEGAAEGKKSEFILFDLPKN